MGWQPSKRVLQHDANQKLIGSYNQNLGGAVNRIHLDLDHLQLLDAVARTGSLAQSAVLLGLTQPALSYRLKEAERRLGVPLFVKAPGRKVQMTAAATRLLPTASMVLREVARAEEDIRRLSDGFHYLLRLGVESRSGFLWLPQFLARLGQEHPELEVDLVCDPSRAGLEALVRSQIDLAVVLASDVGPSFKALPLFDDELVAIMPVDHDLTERPWVEAADFADQALVTDEPWGDGGVHAAAVLVPASVRPARLVGAGSPLAVVDMVGAGFGLGIVSRRMAEAQAMSGRVTLAPIGKRGFQTRWQVVVRSEEAAVSPATFMSERMSYWCEGSVASTLPLINPSAVPA
jgi:LysR family transcriptional regulator for metE and metH